MSGSLKPSKKDAGLRSVHHGGMITPEAAVDLGLANGETVAAIVSVSVGAIERAGALEGFDVPVIYEPREKDRSHCLIDLRDRTANAQQRVSQKALLDLETAVVWRR